MRLYHQESLDRASMFNLTSASASQITWTNTPSTSNNESMTCNAALANEMQREECAVGRRGLSENFAFFLEKGPTVGQFFFSTSGAKWVQIFGV